MKNRSLLLCLIISFIFLIVYLGIGCSQKKENKKTVEPKKSAKSMAKESSKSEPDKKTATKIDVPDASNELELAFKPGDAATDFKLRTTEGAEISLFKQLESKPVLLEFGAYT